MTGADKAGRLPTRGELDFVRQQRVGRLATVDASGAPTVVPLCYAVLDTDTGPLIVSVLDEKPKRVPVRELSRVRNILNQPRVSLIVDHYTESWPELAFVRIDGAATVIEPGEALHGPALASLRGKYPQYESMTLDDKPIVVIRDLTASAWRGSGAETWPEAGGERPGATDLAAIVRGRRSVRSFRPDPVPREIIEQAIAAAGWAPSPHGRQPWRFAVIERADRRQALAEAMAASWRTQLQLDGQSAEVVQIRLDKSRQRLHEAPVLIVPCLYLSDLDVYPDADRQEAERVMAIQSLGAAVQNVLLTVYAAGLDAGWMCAPLFCPDLVREELGLAAELTPHALIPVGYPAKDPVRRPRLPVSDLIVSWD